MRSRPAIRTASGIDLLSVCSSGCCLEVCPNFDPNSEFAGAVLPVNAYRILNEEQDIAHQTELANAYRQLILKAAENLLRARDICPAGIPVEELMSRSNAAAVWKRLKCKRVCGL